MIILFIVAAVVAFTIVFMVGFWAGKHTERARESANRKVFVDEMEKALNKHTNYSMGTGPESPVTLPGNIDVEVKRAQ